MRANRRVVSSLLLSGPERRFRFAERAMLRASKAIICFDNVFSRPEETSPPAAIARYHRV
jgi:hypothetical protein